MLPRPAPWVCLPSLPDQHLPGRPHSSTPAWQALATRCAHAVSLAFPAVPALHLAPGPHSCDFRAWPLCQTLQGQCCSIPWSSGEAPGPVEAELRRPSCAGAGWAQS